MSLTERLDRIRGGAAKRIPADTLEIMHAATAALEATGIAENAIGVGDEAPQFELTDSQGSAVSLVTLRSVGPVVLTFFRGHW